MLWHFKNIVNQLGFKRYLSLIILIGIFFIINEKGWASKSISKRRSIIKSRSNYNFGSCKQFKKKEKYLLECRDSLVHVLPLEAVGSNVEDLAESVELITQNQYEAMMIQDFKNFVINKIEKSYKDVGTELNCLKNKSSKNCPQIVDRLLKLTRKEQPKFRRNIALINPNINLSSPTKMITSNQKLKVPYSSQAMSPLTLRELEKIRKELVLRKNQIVENYNKKTTGMRRKCITYEEEEALVSQKTPYCRRKVSPVLRSKLKREFKDNYQKEFNKQVSVFPFLGYLTTGDISQVSDEKLESDLKNSLEQVQNEIGSSRDKIKGWEPKKIKDLFRYEDLISEYLKQKNPPTRHLCDAVENIYDWHKDGGWWSISADIGLGTAAILGGGICFFTAGLGCAVGVAAISVAADIGRTQLKINNTKSDYKGGLASREEIEDALIERQFAIVFAPLSFIGLESGKGLKPGLKIARNSLSNSVNDLKTFITKLGPIRMRNLVKAEKIYGYTDVSKMIELASSLPQNTQDEIFEILKDPDIVQSEAFEKLLSKLRKKTVDNCLDSR